MSFVGEVNRLGDALRAPARHGGPAAPERRRRGGDGRADRRTSASRSGSSSTLGDGERGLGAADPRRARGARAARGPDRLHAPAAPRSSTAAGPPRPRRRRRAKRVSAAAASLASAGGTCRLAGRSCSRPTWCQFIDEVDADSRHSATAERQRSAVSRSSPGRVGVPPWPHGTPPCPGGGNPLSKGLSKGRSG